MENLKDKLLFLSGIFAKPHKDKIEICITVDGDLVKNVKISKKAISNTRKLFDSSNLKGKVTWFINEREYQWTKNYQDELKEIEKTGDEIALHSHELRNGVVGYKQIYNAIAEDKNNLENFFKNKIKIVSFRSGNHMKSKELFKVLEKLKFKFDSSFVPEFKVEPYFDDRTLLIRGGIFKINNLLEIPNQIQSPNTIKRRIKGAKNKIVICYHFHAYDLVNKKNGKFNMKNWLKYRYLFYTLKKVFPNHTFKKMSDIKL